MKIGSLFSGIGGLELGLERSRLGSVSWQCEIDPFCQRVLARHWPHARRFEDVRTVDATAPSVDVICGGFPCQDVSLAGKRGGLDAPRSGLWHEFARIIGELEPKIVIIENVLGLRTSGLPRVLADLADLGFDAEWADLAASDIGAPHQRRRMFIVATHSERVNVRLEPGGSSGRVGKLRPSIDSILRMALIPTPTVCGDWNRRGASPRSGDGLGTLAGSSITLRGWMMGFPRGWTWVPREKRSATQSSRPAPK
mgnify:CR=1 FL=1